MRYAALICLVSLSGYNCKKETNQEKEIGEACNKDTECKRCFCRFGICSRSDCNKHSDCGTKGHCLPNQECVVPCEQGSSCPSGTVCDWHPIVRIKRLLGYDGKRDYEKVRNNFGLFKQCINKREK
jgi:hypothetical protein